MTFQSCASCVLLRPWTILYPGMCTAVVLAAVLPQVTMLGFGLNQFPGGYSKSGDLQNAIDALTWGADYLVAAHSSPNHFVAVVGNSTLDFAYYVSEPGDGRIPLQIPAGV